MISYGVLDSKKKNRLKFSPDDKIMDVYGALYPPCTKGGVDALELESFDMRLGKKYGLTLSKMNSNITLGELFEMVIRKNSGF